MISASLVSQAAPETATAIRNENPRLGRASYLLPFGGIPDYHGEKLYQASPSVSDRFVITANGLAPFAFAAEIFRALAPEQKRDIETYEKLYSHGMLD